LARVEAMRKAAIDKMVGQAERPDGGPLKTKSCSHIAAAIGCRRSYRTSPPARSCYGHGSPDQEC
jgi:hypothetical protein